MTDIDIATLSESKVKLNFQQDKFVFPSDISYISFSSLTKKRVSTPHICYATFCYFLYPAVSLKIVLI